MSYQIGINSLENCLFRHRLQISFVSNAHEEKDISITVQSLDASPYSIAGLPTSIFMHSCVRVALGMHRRTPVICHHLSSPRPVHRNTKLKNCINFENRYYKGITRQILIFEPKYLKKIIIWLSMNTSVWYKICIIIVYHTFKGNGYPYQRQLSKLSPLSIDFHTKGRDFVHLDSKFVPLWTEPFTKGFQGPTGITKVVFLS